MRTVTFSRSAVQALLDDRFVSTWHNQAPDVFPVGSGDPQKASYPQSYYDEFPDGAGGANVKLFFCTFEGKIVHYTQGYLTPESLKVEAEFALGLLKNTKKPAKATLKAAHAAMIQSLRKELRGLQTRERTPANTRKQPLLQVRVFNHQLAEERLLEDPKTWMVNEDLGFL